MFTGIIEAVGRVRSVSARSLEAAVPADWVLTKGESVAVNGVCLTATALSPGLAAFDVSGETLRKTALGALKKDSPVNLERAMRADGRFSGHFVTGHADGTVRLLAVNRAAVGYVLTFEAPAGAALVEKGSVALDGVSLTVFGLSDGVFKAAVIPHTWENTALRHARPGALLNAEYDVLGKYALKKAGSAITRDFLAENGFLS